MASAAASTSARRRNHPLSQAAGGSEPKEEPGASSHRACVRSSGDLSRAAGSCGRSASSERRVKDRTAEPRVQYPPPCDSSSEPPPRNGRSPSATRRPERQEAEKAPAALTKLCRNAETTKRRHPWPAGLRQTYSSRSPGVSHRTKVRKILDTTCWYQQQWPADEEGVDGQQIAAVMGPMFLGFAIPGTISLGIVDSTQDKMDRATHLKRVLRGPMA